MSDDKQKKKFLEKIIKYMKYDDLIKSAMAEQREKLKELKIQRYENEQAILKYLESEEKDIITIAGFDELKKSTTVRIIPLNQETIKSSIFEKMMVDEIFPSEEICYQYVDTLYDFMKDKREKKIKICLKRKKQKKSKK